MAGSLPSAIALARWGRRTVFVVEIGMRAEAVAIHDLAEDLELGRERSVPGEHRRGIKLAKRYEDAVSSARAEGISLLPSESTNDLLKVKGGIKEDSLGVDKLGLSGTRQTRMEV
jgi:hypothetical protein